MKHILLFAAAAAVLPACVSAQAPATAVPAQPGPSAEAVVESFHRALAEGNRDAALALLADDVLILEAGHAERSKAEYAAEHLGADMEFTRAVPTVVVRRSSGMDGNMAWVATEGRTSGNFHGRVIDKLGTETMVLHRGPDGWRISHIHWSSADPF